MKTQKLLNVNLSKKTVMEDELKCVELFREFLSAYKLEKTLSVFISEF